MKNESNVIFYYPLGDGAPSLVGRNIFLQLFNMRKSLPFDELSLYSHSKNIDYLKNKFEDINIYTEKDIFNVSSGLVHIPISPLLFPNSKLLLHLYAKMKNIPLIFNYHGDIRTEMAFDFKTNKNINLSYVPSYLFLPYILKSADQLIVHSYLFKNLVADSYGVTNSKVIPNAVDDYWFSSEYEQITLENGLKLFYHGRLSGEKGVDILIKAVHKYIHSENNFEIMLYIAGDGPQKGYLEKLVRKLDLQQNIFLLGLIDKKQIKGYLRKVDVAIYPSLWDNFPLSYIEAFSCADCPVFFSRKAGIYDFVSIQGNKLCSFDPSVDNICNIISLIANDRIDLDVVNEQKKFAIRYNWRNVVNDYIESYAQYLY